MVGVDLSTSPKRHPCHTHTGFVTLVINLINRRCCSHHRCYQHHRLTLDISLYCMGSREIRFSGGECGGKTSLEGNNSSSICYVTFLVYFFTRRRAVWATFRWRYCGLKKQIKYQVANITFHKLANKAVGKNSNKTLASFLILGQVQFFRKLVNLAK